MRLNSDPKIEDLAKRLSELASRKPLSGNDVDVVKDIISKLREMGLTNKRAQVKSDIIP